MTGFDAEFNQLRIQIHGKDQLPSIKEVFSIIQCKKNRRAVMIGSLSLMARQWQQQEGRPNKH